MSTTERRPGRIALMVAHCAGMVDLVALPVWVGTLVAHYRFDAQQAGGLATLFLAGAVASSLYFAPRFDRLRGRRAAPIGFAVAALAFAANALTVSWPVMAVLHLVAGVAAACGLSITHGTIGRSERPHRLFALVGIALGVFAILFLGLTPRLVAGAGGASLFVVFGAVMAVAALTSALMFPSPPPAQPEREAQGTVQRMDAPVWFAAIGTGAMALVQAMTFSFLERIGADRGFGLAAVTGVLVALGVVNLFPALLAALLERRLPARSVVLAGPAVQAALALTIAGSTAFAPYAGAAMFFAFVMIFTHTFAFGLIARLDPSGRVLAATPAMLMVGAAVGPILGGTLVKLAGYPSLGVAAVVIDTLAIACFTLARRPEAPAVGIASRSHP